MVQEAVASAGGTKGDKLPDQVPGVLCDICAEQLGKGKKRVRLLATAHHTPLSNARTRGSLVSRGGSAN